MGYLIAQFHPLSFLPAEDSAPHKTAEVLVSTVSALVRAQLEFDDPLRGFQRREGSNELLLRIREPLQP